VRWCESSPPSEPPSLTLDLGTTMDRGVVTVVVGLDTTVVLGVVGGTVVGGTVGATVVGAIVVGATVVDGSVVVGSVVDGIVVAGVVGATVVVAAWAPTCNDNGTSAVAPPVPVKVMSATTPATENSDPVQMPQRDRRRLATGWCAGILYWPTSSACSNDFLIRQFSPIFDPRVDTSF